MIHLAITQRTASQRSFSFVLPKADQASPGPNRKPTTAPMPAPSAVPTTGTTDPTTPPATAPALAPRTDGLIPISVVSPVLRITTEATPTPDTLPFFFAIPHTPCNNGTTTWPPYRHADMGRRRFYPIKSDILVSWCAWRWIFRQNRRGPSVIVASRTSARSPSQPA